MTVLVEHRAEVHVTFAFVSDVALDRDRLVRAVEESLESNLVMDMFMFEERVGDKVGVGVEVVGAVAADGGRGF